jgi:hypothetical protein
MAFSLHLTGQTLRTKLTPTILPSLRDSGMSLSALSRKTGLSRRYLKTILDGDAVPHPMHWEPLAAVAVYDVPT